MFVYNLKCFFLNASVRLQHDVRLQIIMNLYLIREILLSGCLLLRAFEIVQFKHQQQQ